MNPGDLVRFKTSPEILGVVLGPEYVPTKGKKYTKYQLQMLQVLRMGGSNPAQIIRAHCSHLELVE
jgi:hypothetical protein